MVQTVPERQVLYLMYGQNGKIVNGTIMTQQAIQFILINQKCGRQCMCAIQQKLNVMF